MSLWDWLFAAWIYDSIFNDKDEKESRNDSHDYSSPYDQQNYYEDLDDDDYDRYDDLDDVDDYDDYDRYEDDDY